MLEIDRRIGAASQVLKEIMAAPDQSVPEELLSRCQAIAIYPSVLKGGFILGARYGRGLVLNRGKDGKWGPVAFSTIGGGSWGLQAGAESTDLILVVMNKRSLEGLLSDNFTLGADASIAAGPIGRSASISTGLTLRAGIFSYSRSRGLFGGIALDGAVLTQDNASNAAYYGKEVSSKDILLDDAVEPKPSSAKLRASLEEYSARWGKKGKQA